MPRIDLPFVVEKQHITQPTHETIVSGGKNYFYATFKIDEIWENITPLRAVFARDDVNKLVDLTATEDGYECRIPWEVIFDKGILNVGIFGGDRLLTDYAYVVVKQGCITDGGVPQPPSEDWFNKIEKELQDINEEIENIGEVDETNLVHKTGDEEVSGIKTFKDGIKVNTIKGVSIVEDEEWEDINVDIVATTETDGTGFIRLLADNDIDIDTNFGSVYINGELPLTEGDLDEVYREIENVIDGIVYVNNNQYISGRKFFEDLHISCAEYDCGSIEGFDYFINEGEVGEQRLSGINIKTERLLYSGKEVATKDDITSALGNIETALDTAIALCDSLIGGAV